MGNCAAFEHACFGATVQCAAGENCDISCTSGEDVEVCEDVTIYCPNGGDCSITCTEDYACHNAVIDARDSASLSLTCNTAGTHTCTGLTIYFPENDNGEKKGIISAGDNSFSSSNARNGMQFYAKNGWSDVSIINYSGAFIHMDGAMHCGADYAIECALSSTAWACDSNVCDL